MAATPDTTDEDISSPADEEGPILNPTPSWKTPHLPAHRLPTPESAEEEDNQEDDQEEEEEDDQEDDQEEEEEEQGESDSQRRMVASSLLHEVQEVMRAGESHRRHHRHRHHRRYLKGKSEQDGDGEREEASPLRWMAVGTDSGVDVGGEGDGDGERSRDGESESESEIEVDWESEVDVDCVVDRESDVNRESDINHESNINPGSDTDDQSTSISFLPPPTPAFWTPLLFSILVLTVCIALQLQSISTQRQWFEVTRPPYPHPTIPAVPDFPPVDLARFTRQLPTSGLARSGSVDAPVSRVLERVTRQVEEVVDGFNRATKSTVGKWNRGLEEAVEGEVRAREREGAMGRVMRDVEWWIGGSAVLRRCWTGGRAMAKVEMAVQESEELWPGRMWVMEGEFAKLGAAMRGLAGVVEALRQEGFARLVVRGEGEDGGGGQWEGLDGVLMLCVTSLEDAARRAEKEAVRFIALGQRGVENRGGLGTSCA